MVINGVYHSEIFGETYVGQNIWAPYMTQALAGTPVEAVSNANIGASIPQRGLDACSFAVPDSVAVAEPLR